MWNLILTELRYQSFIHQV